MVRWIAALGLTGLLAACGATPAVRATSAAAGSVSYEFPPDRQEEASRQATLYCANLGQRAVLSNRTLEATGLAAATYDCR
jgi:hypothetical protein